MISSEANRVSVATAAYKQSAAVRPRLVPFSRIVNEA
jgi:hypothetical protein